MNALKQVKILDLTDRDLFIETSTLRFSTEASTLFGNLFNHPGSFPESFNLTFQGKTETFKKSKRVVRDGELVFIDYILPYRGIVIQVFND